MTGVAGSSSVCAPWQQPATIDDATAAAAWAESGAQWLTDPRVPVPTRLVGTALGLIEYLDALGARLTDELPGRGLGVLGERAAALGLTTSGTTSCGGATRFVRAADGWLALSLARDADVELLPAWLAPVEVCPGDPWPQITAAARRPTGQLVDAAGELGLACAAVAETDDRRPVHLEPLGTAEPRPLAGAVVADLGALWAAPLAGDLLARLGARVIKIESTTRPDGMRAHVELFDVWNGRSESVALPLATSDGRRALATLLERVDVVVEASRPRALAQLGIDARALTARGPRIWLSITAYGRHGTAARRIGFGDDAAAAGGLVGWVDGTPRFVGDAIADPLSGLTAAATVAHLCSTGGRWLADVALARVAAWCAPRPGDPVVPARPEPARPRHRRPIGSLPLGRDTATVLTEFAAPGG